VIRPSQQISRICRSFNRGYVLKHPHSRFLANKFSKLWWEMPKFPGLSAKVLGFIMRAIYSVARVELAWSFTRPRSIPFLLEGRRASDKVEASKIGAKATSVIHGMWLLETIWSSVASELTGWRCIWWWDMTGRQSWLNQSIWVYIWRWYYAEKGIFWIL
jgi:hypothetical protein